MKKKERIISAIELKSVDRIPTSYRGTKHINIELYDYFGLSDYNNSLVNNYKEFLKKIGADIWS